MPEREYGQLRVLVANQLPERAEAVSKIARSLGHEVVALELDVDKVASGKRSQSDAATSGRTAWFLCTRARGATRRGVGPVESARSIAD
jgi:hypothetical protein